jgi:hypothetical protein
MKLTHLTPEMLVDYFAGRWTLDQERVIDSHLSECDSCVELGRSIYKHAYIWDTWTARRQAQVTRGLVLTDHEMPGRQNYDLLGARDNKVVFVSSLEDAVSKSTQEDFDVLGIDVHAKGINSVKLALKILEHRAQLPIRIVTGHDPIPAPALDTAGVKKEVLATSLRVSTITTTGGARHIAQELPKLGIYVSAGCRRRKHSGQGLYEFREFLRTYWPVLAKYKVFISEETRPIFQEVAAARVKNPEFELTLSPLGNSRQFLNQISKVPEVETVLFFLDTEHLQEEIEGLLIFCDGANGKKLFFNWSAAKWAQRQLDSAERTLDKSAASPGPNDAIILIGEQNQPSDSGFIKKHLKKLMRFRERVVTPDVLHALATNPPANPGGLTCVPVEKLDFATSLVKTFRNSDGGSDLVGKFCNVVLCTGRQQVEKPAVRHFLQLCFNPVYRTNVMINQPSAEYWIDRL